MIAKRYLYLPLLSILLFAACKKSSVNPNNKQTTPKADTDVYVVGNLAASNGAAVAAYWKNGVAVKLTDSSANSAARAITIQPNGDIYIAGFILGSSSATRGIIQAAAYWKNGTMTRLNNELDFSDAFGIVVLGTDMYVGGITSDDYQVPIATYWKNNTEVQLPVGWDGSDAYAIATNGTDVFFAGDSKLTNNVSDGYVPTYWKNNAARIILPGINVSQYGQVNGIAINGNDIYMAGYTNNGAGYTPAYWKNGVITSLTGSNEDYANAIATNGTDVYIAGTTVYNNHTIACYWKNGNNLNRLTAGLTNSAANGVVMVGTDVYIAGSATDANGKSTACYWKNGVLVSLPRGASSTTQGLGIAVVPH